MPDTKPADAASPGAEIENAFQRQARIRREAELIAEAEAEIDAGFWLDEAELDAWLAAVAVDENAPLPAAKGRTP